VEDEVIGVVDFVFWVVGCGVEVGYVVGVGFDLVEC